MLKHTIKYEDFEGRPVEEEFYFNLTEAELAEMELSEKGGMLTYLQTIVAKQDTKAIVAAFKEILLKSVGEKSEDGRRFLKTQHIRDDFHSSGAYSVLFMQLVSDAEFSAKFVNGIMPAKLVQKAQERAKDNVVDINTARVENLPQLTPEKLAELSNTAPAAKKTLKDYTYEELGNLSAEEFENLKRQQNDTNLFRNQ